MFETDRTIPAGDLSDDDLLQQLESLHRTRHETLRHGSDQALAHHDARLTELEAEYLRRFPEREVDPARLRPPDDDAPPGRAAHSTDPPIRTGAEQPWEPEDLVAAKGQDPTPENLARARAELDHDGARAVEKVVP